MTRESEGTHPRYTTIRVERSGSAFSLAESWANQTEAEVLAYLRKHHAKKFSYADDWVKFETPTSYIRIVLSNDLDLPEDWAKNLGDRLAQRLKCG